MKKARDKKLMITRGLKTLRTAQSDNFRLIKVIAWSPKGALTSSSYERTTLKSSEDLEVH